MPAPRKLAQPKALSDEVAPALEKLGMNVVIDTEDILNAWCDIVPPIIAGNTRPSGLRNGCLEISVLQSSIHYTLEREMKPHLLNRLQSLFGRRHIREIRFRLG
jgi:predicted nucleic acid-binding Zn ribbon protein